MDLRPRRDRRRGRAPRDLRGGLAHFSERLRDSVRPNEGAKACTHLAAGWIAVMRTAVPQAYLPLKGGGRPPSAAKAVGWGSFSEQVSPTRLASLGDLPLLGGGNARLCL